MPRWIVNPVKGLWQLAKESFKQYGVSRTKVIIEVEFSYSKAQDANALYLRLNLAIVRGNDYSWFVCHEPIRLSFLQ